jgi:hypothetical protein
LKMSLVRTAKVERIDGERRFAAVAKSLSSSVARREGSRDPAVNQNGSDGHSVSPTGRPGPSKLDVPRLPQCDCYEQIPRVLAYLV